MDNTAIWAKEKRDISDGTILLFPEMYIQGKLFFYSQKGIQYWK